MSQNEQSIEESLISKIEPNIFCVKTDRMFILEEKTDPSNSYKIEFIQSKNAKSFLIEPSKMKEQTKYLKQKPKDCDYVILDFNRNIAYFIELKLSAQSSTAKSTFDQLKSGQKWIEHLMFLLGHDDIINKFKKFYICCKHDSRQDRKKSLSPNPYGVININGCKVDLREFISL